jgi:single-strand DNA-binding protein
MLNQCNFIGRVGQLPDMKYSPAGAAVVNFSIAVSKKFKDREGNRQERTEWISVVAWRQLAEIIGKYVVKGQLVFISGEFQTRKWKDRDGNDRYTTEIVADQMQMLGRAGDDQRDSQEQSAQSYVPETPQRPAPAQQGQPNQAQLYEEPAFNPDEEEPF